MLEIGKGADKPQFTKNCVDDPKFDCAKMQSDGSCLVSLQKVGKACPKTCGLCEQCMILFSKGLHA